MKKLTTTKQNRHGNTVNIAGVELTFSKEGIAEISEEDFKKLPQDEEDLAAYKIFPYEGEKSGAQVDEDGVDFEEMMESDTPLGEQLAGLKLTQLKSVAQQIGIPEGGYKSLKAKAAVIEVIMGTLESAAEGTEDVEETDETQEVDENETTDNVE
jgi:hypothetical protein